MNLERFTTLVIKSGKRDSLIDCCFSFLIVLSIIINSLIPIFLTHLFGDKLYIRILGYSPIIFILPFILIVYRYKKTKTINTLLNESKKLGLMTMYSPIMKKRNEKYILSYYPFYNKFNSRIEFDLTKDQYVLYKNKLKELSFGNRNMPTVVIDTNTGLFDGNKEIILFENML